MNARTLGFALFAAVLLAACGSRQQALPVSIRRCDAVVGQHGFTVAASLRNDAQKPISAVRVAVDFYQDFRFSQFSAAAKLARELDPGQTQDVVLTVQNPARTKVVGKAMRCYATHVDYLDGTKADLRPQTYH
jgi:hypothetical protein